MSKEQGFKVQASRVKHPESKHTEPRRFLKGRFKRLRCSGISNNSLCNDIYKAVLKINLPMNNIESDN